MIIQTILRLNIVKNNKLEKWRNDKTFKSYVHQVVTTGVGGNVKTSGSYQKYGKKYYTKKK
jgi:hypothetical protein